MVAAVTLKYKCDGKAKYRSERAARMKLRLKKERGDKNLNIYFCNGCKKFHIGHDR